MSDTATTEEKIDDWFIVEMMGHRKLAGHLKNVSIAGHGMLRLDMWGLEPGDALTQYISPASIYALTPTTEELARRFAAQNLPKPVHAYELPQLPARSEPTDAELCDDDDAGFEGDDDPDDGPPDSFDPPDSPGF